MSPFQRRFDRRWLAVDGPMCTRQEIITLKYSPRRRRNTPDENINSGLGGWWAGVTRESEASALLIIRRELATDRILLVDQVCVSLSDDSPRSGNIPRVSAMQPRG